MSDPGPAPDPLPAPVTVPMAGTAGSGIGDAERLVWYVSYGSNMSRDRFLCYLLGGTPAGAQHGHPGARDKTPPAAVAAVTLPGRLFFAGHSVRWGGAPAFYDHSPAPAPAPDVEAGEEAGEEAGLGGETLAVAWLITLAQFADVVAQEMGFEPGNGPATSLNDAGALEHVLASGRHELGPGRYETLIHVGDRDGHPMLTFTCPDPVALRNQAAAPAAAYLETIAAGLAAVHLLPLEDALTHLSTLAAL